MGKRRAGALALAVALALGACSAPAPRIAPPPLPELRPPAVEDPTYPVGVRVLRLRRGPGRPLHTLVFYPAAAEAHAVFSSRDDPPRPSRLSLPSRPSLPPLPSRPSLPPLPSRPVAGAEPAIGRFPLVLFSHGLTGSPERYAPLLAAWAAAGFVVAAPTYPYTNQHADPFRRADIVNQPADARYVLNRVLRLAITHGDPLWHRIDGAHIAAVGHSAGGYTTTGLFTAGHDPRLRAGVIMAGWAVPGAFAGAPAEMLFVQGTADPVVPVSVSRAVYARVPWPRSFLLLRKESHGTYLRPGTAGYRRVRSVVADFLRWTLLGDERARQRLPARIYPPLRG